MHYKNGREAKNGDPVVTRSYDGQSVISGVIDKLQSGETQCNCDVVFPVMGGTDRLTCQNTRTMFHAEDAFNAVNVGGVKPEKEK